MLHATEKMADAFNRHDADRCPRCDAELVDPVAGLLVFVSCRGCRAVLKRTRDGGRWSSEVVR